MGQRKGEGLAAKISRPVINLNPNVLSVLSLVMAGVGGLMYYRSGNFLLLAFLAILVSAYLDAADGQAARHQGIVSKKGDLLDHFFDRYSDVLMVVGIGLSTYSNPYLCIGALEGILMTSYMGTQAQALGLERDYAGPLGRAYRLVVIMAAALLQFLLPYSYQWIFTINVTAIALLWFFIGGNFTAIYRFVRAYRKL